MGDNSSPYRYQRLSGGEAEVVFRSRSVSNSSMADPPSSTENGTHCHTELSARMPEVDKIARKKLIVASVLCLLFTIGEATGGILAGSLAVATDSAHMLTDFTSFMISLLAIHLASRPATTNLSFGWHRAEIIGALVSVQLIWVVTGVLVYMAVQRVINQDYKIDAVPMIATAGAAVFVNIILGMTLHGVGGHNHSHFGGGHSHSKKDEDVSSENPLLEDVERNSATYGATSSNESEDANHGHSHSKENLNVRAALIHVIGDLIQSIGVLVAAIIIYFKPEWKIADPICTFIFSVLVLISTLNILKDAIRVLMEATPRHIEYKVMKDLLTSVKGVKYVHNLRIWSLTTSKFTMSVHLAVDNISRSQEILQEASQLLWKKFDIQDSTIQIESYASEMDDCDHCQDPVDH